MNCRETMEKNKQIGPRIVINGIYDFKRPIKWMFRWSWGHPKKQDYKDYVDTDTFEISGSGDFPV